MSEEGSEHKKGRKKIRNFLVIGVFLVISLMVWQGARNKAEAANAPAMFTYQGKVLVSGEAATTTLNMAFVIYDALTDGNVLYTASGTLGATSTVEVTPSSGLFSVNLGDTGTNGLSPSIFRDNAALYLEVAIEGQVLIPRKRITATPYAFNAKYLDGVGTTSTASTSVYIPMSDAAGNFDFNTVTSTGVYVNGGVTTTGNIYVTGNSKVGIGTSTPDFSLSLSGDGGILAQGTVGAGASLGFSPFGSASMIWYPAKGAFRAGATDDSLGYGNGLEWDDANIGSYSTAFNYNTLANGVASFAAGASTTASGMAAVAFGALNVASGQTSFVGGVESTASGEQSFAFGASTLASGAKSVALGNSAIASGDQSVAIGDTVTANNPNSMAFGTDATSSAIGAIALGKNITVTGVFSVGVGLTDASSYTVTGNNVFAVMGGNFGVATSSPGFPLSVSGTAYISGGIYGGGWYGEAISALYGGTGLDSSSWTGLVRVTSGTWSTSTVDLASSADVTGILPVANGGTGTSTFSNGSLVYVQSNTFQGDPNKLSWDAVNERLGVGTSTPQSKIHLTGGTLLQTIGAASTPTRVGGLNLLDGTVYDLAVQGNYAYAVMEDTFGENDEEFQIFDVSNPSVPQKVGGVNIVTDWGFASRIYVAGRYAYLSGLYSTASSGIMIYDISNPAVPVRKGLIETSAYPRYVSGNYLYCSGGVTAGADFSIFDVTDPSNPTELSALDTAAYMSGSGEDLWVAGRYAYLASSGGNGSGAEMVVIDIIDPKNPAVVGSADLSAGSNNLSNIYVSGRYAYVIGGGLNPATANAELAIIDVASSSAPTAVAYMNLDSSDSYSIYVSGKYAYVGVSDSSVYSNKDLLVIDVSSSTNPFYVTGVDMVSSNAPLGITVSGRYLYLGASNATVNNEDFQVYDITGIDAPAANFGSLYSYNLSVADNLQVANNLYVANAINIGNGGLFSAGGASIHGLGATSSTIGLAVYNSVGTSTLYVSDGGEIGIGTSTPEFKLDIDSDGGIIARGTYGSGTMLATNATGTRMIWYPRKAAFRAGHVSATQWDDANIGDYSFVGGLDNKVTSTAGTAFGAYNTVTGDYSLAIGASNSVTGARSVALGSAHNVSGTRSAAFGGANTVSGSYSAAFGETNTITGSHSVVFGNANSASGTSAVAMGTASRADGSYSFAGGVNVVTNAGNTFVYGRGFDAGNKFTNNTENSFMVGFQSIAGQEPALFVSGAGDASQVGINTTTFSSYKLMVDSGSDGGAGLGVHGYIKATSYITGTTTLDLAETYPVDANCAASGNCPAVGDVVCLKDGATATIEKCATAYATDAIGVVSTNPGLILGGSDLGLDTVTDDDVRLVALAGRVPVRVSGEVRVGDKLAASPVPGVAMKATHEGAIIGIALEDYTSFGEGLVTAFVNVGWNNILYRGLTLDETGGKITVGSAEVPYNLELAGGLNMLLASENKMNFATGTILETSLSGQAGARAFILNALNFSTTSTDQYLLSIRSNNQPRFSVAANGDVHAFGDIYANSLVLGTSTNPGDLAERVDIAADDIVEAGDVVVVDERSPDTYHRSGGAYEQAVAGVISTNPTIVVGNGKTDYTAVMAMVGRVPVKVSAENGEIKRGDLLVTASTTGYAMKYDTEKDNGLRMVGVVGVALEPLSSSSTGKIMALIRTGWVNNRVETLVELQQNVATLAAGTGIDLAADPGDVSIENNGGSLEYTGGNLNLAGNSILNVAQIVGRDSKWAIDTEGRFITRVATTQGDKEMFAMQSPVSEFVFSSSSQLAAGEIRVEFDAQTKEIIDEDAPLKVTVTLTSGEAAGVFVKEKGPWGFVVKELAGGTSAATFDWIVVAKRKINEAPVEAAEAQESDGVISGGGGSDSEESVQEDNEEVAVEGEGEEDSEESTSSDSEVTDSNVESENSSTEESSAPEEEVPTPAVAEESAPGAGADTGEGMGNGEIPSEPVEPPAESPPVDVGPVADVE